MKPPCRATEPRGCSHAGAYVREEGGKFFMAQLIFLLYGVVSLQGNVLNMFFLMNIPPPSSLFAK